MQTANYFYYGKNDPGSYNGKPLLGDLEAVTVTGGFRRSSNITQYVYESAAVEVYIERSIALGTLGNQTLILSDPTTWRP